MNARAGPWDAGTRRRIALLPSESPSSTHSNPSPPRIPPLLSAPSAISYTVGGELNAMARPAALTDTIVSVALVTGTRSQVL